MNCQRCNSERVLSLNSKQSDLCFSEFMGEEKDGYAPDVDNVCSGDYTAFSVCLECGQMQGNFPVKHPIEKNEDNGFLTLKYLKNNLKNIESILRENIIAENRRSIECAEISYEDGIIVSNQDCIDFVFRNGYKANDPIDGVSPADFLRQHFKDNIPEDFKTDIMTEDAVIIWKAKV